ncbi:hypothetical protein [Staphylococcus delphini]|uniref:Uncharacterized protein n=1 Tax=Staphylococcus delphini TaxID=53344 RepID=A0AAX0QT79_9STAP|nr:hypothetical protein [Staphylococcus delphini]PCF50081.1 hypothetical protein B5C07_07690 [Staphylococcus delphini]PNZ95702.1 hypothetical protein CD148_03230 [Staphylococcus delphini]RIZ56287.1 hypothetical protein CDL68_01735 [Staphylococcus delphini]VED62523.1 Uncharacterised protein [Staphylococcus delphini]
MIEEIVYDKSYKCESADGKVTGSFSFIKSDLGDTWITFITNGAKQINVKNILLTTEPDVDEFDIETVNIILKDSNLQFAGYAE